MTYNSSCVERYAVYRNGRDICECRFRTDADAIAEALKTYDQVTQGFTKADNVDVLITRNNQLKELNDDLRRLYNKATKELNDLVESVRSIPLP